MHSIKPEKRRKPVIDWAMKMGLESNNLAVKNLLLFVQELWNLKIWKHRTRTGELFRV